MSVAAEPKPLQGALSGGLSGATVRVHPLLVARRLAPPGFWRRPSGPLARARTLAAPRSTWRPLPVVAFLVEHPQAGAILVDTGFHASVADDPRHSLGRLAARLHMIDMRPEQAVPAQLERRELDPRDVTIVVMTHLHHDHASGVSQFPQATFVVALEEWRAAARGGLRDGYRPRQFDHAFDWRTVDYDGPGARPWASFGRTVDLLGDGSIRLVATPGHSPGHQSVVCRLRDRELLLCGDAAYRRAALAGGEVPAFCADEHRYLRSLRELRRYCEQTPRAVAIPGHDPELWPSLDDVYA